VEVTAGTVRERALTLCGTVLAVLLVSAVGIAAVGAAGASGAERVALAATAAACVLALALPVRRLLRDRFLSTLQTAVLILAVGLMLVVGLGPRLGRYQFITVLSGSMKPTYDAGDLILVRPQPMGSIRPGQVIVYHVPTGDRQVVAHRVVKILSGEGTAHPVVQTKGDANNGVDPWTAQLTGGQVWVYTLTIPYAGHAIQVLREPSVHRILLYGAAGLLLILGLYSIWRPTRPTLARDAR
jgi:signal peptidase